MDFKKLFSEQSLVRVVLNGGKTELEDATVPFTIGFEAEIADKKPTHVLVVDIPYDNYKTFSSGIEPLNAHRVRNGGERKIYELSKLDFIQFHRPGKHNLVFFLLSNPKKENKKYFLQKTGLSSESYEHSVAENIFWDKKLVVGFCEELVEIPEEFFSVIPETGFKKWWWNWVNRWFPYNDPLDQCAFRRRVPLAVTLQPVAWFLGFLLRFIVTLAFNIVTFVGVIVIFLCGGQAKKKLFTEIFQFDWDFVFMYRRVLWDEVFLPLRLLTKQKYYNEERCYVFGKKEIKLITSPAGLTIQAGLWFLFINTVYRTFTPGDYFPSLGAFILSLATGLLATIHLIECVIGWSPFKKVKNWRKLRFVDVPNEHGEREINPFALEFRRWVVGLYALLFLALNITQFVSHFREISKVSKDVANSTIDFFTYDAIKIIACVIAAFIILWKAKFLWGKFVSGLEWALNFILGLFPERKVSEAKFEPSDNVVKVRQKTTSSHTEWLKQNMNIKKLPERVEFNNLIAPTKTATMFLRFKTTFWRTKTKVCKPYAR